MHRFQPVKMITGTSIAKSAAKLCKDCNQYRPRWQVGCANCDSKTKFGIALDNWFPFLEKFNRNWVFCHYNFSAYFLDICPLQCPHCPGYEPDSRRTLLREYNVIECREHVCQGLVTSMPNILDSEIGKVPIYMVMFVPLCKPMSPHTPCDYCKDIVIHNPVTPTRPIHVEDDPFECQCKECGNLPFSATPSRYERLLKAPPVPMKPTRAPRMSLHGQQARVTRALFTAAPTIPKSLQDGLSGFYTPSAPCRRS